MYPGPPLSSETATDDPYDATRQGHDGRLGDADPLRRRGMLSIVWYGRSCSRRGAADWAIASVGYSLVVFLDYAFGATLLGAWFVAGGPEAKRLATAAAS